MEALSPRAFDALPDHALAADGPLGSECLRSGIATLRELGRTLCHLPYGRPADRAEWRSVLSKGHGTCSTKHAFLAATAAEQRCHSHSPSASTR